MTYEVFAKDNANQIGAFDTEEEALLEIRWAIENYGVEWVDALVLGEIDAQGRPRFIAEGRELAQLALATVEAQRAS